MPVYITVPFDEDPDALAQIAIDYIQAAFPGWVPNAGNLDTIQIEALARIGSVVVSLASRVPTAIFRYLGGSLFNIPPLNASFASTTTTWTMRDDAGYTIPAGTYVGVRVAGDDLVAFRTFGSVTVAPGDTETAAGAVTIVAVEAGSAESGLGGMDAAVELIDQLDYVTAITMTDITTGGTDGESDTDYVDRMADELTLLTPTPIIPNDFAVLARHQPGVRRALALDGYNPDDETFDNERMIAVALQNDVGQPATSLVKTNVDALLQSLRETNFVVNIIDPTYTTIDVSAAFTTLAGYGAATVEAAVEAAVSSYLDPAVWGSGPTAAAPSRDPAAWADVSTIRYLELATVINEVAGVDYIVALALGAQVHKNYTVVASTNELTSTAHGYSNGDLVTVVAATDGAPLAVGGLYYVRDVATDTFKVALTSGGAAIDITTDGSGTVQKVAAADVSMSGVATLPEAGVITGTAV